jgi:cell division protein FtsQ
MRMKRTLTIIVATLLSAYLIFAMLMLHGKKEEIDCQNLIVVIKDSTDRQFLTKDNIVTMLKNAQLYPVGKPLESINTHEMKEKIMESELVSGVSVYKTPSGNIKIEITQKMPILRVFSGHESYYVDESGGTMPANYLYATYLPVANGNIEKSLATTELYKFALFLQKNEFWNNQIEQIYVNTNKEVELIPRIGEHRIILGSFEDFEEKMNNLRLFYEQAIPKVGWEKYEVINLKYKNQIVCTKK